MQDREQMMRRQQALADFGEFALGSENLDEILTEACRLVGETLGTGRAKILEMQRDGRVLLVRAVAGWDPGIVGRLRLPMSERSSETFSIREGRPVVTQDIRAEERFEFRDFMKRAGVIAVVNVPILVPGRRAYGLLQVDATEPRDFGQEDITFLRSYATILGPVIDRLHKVRDLQESEERFRRVVESARDYAIFTTDPEDRITDWLPGAEAVFGWSAQDAVGQTASILFTPEDRAAGEDDKEIETAKREGPAPNVRWHLHKDGTRVFIEGAVTALRGADGALRGFLKIGQDVTERRRAEERLRNAFAIKTVGIIFWGPAFGLTEANDAFLEMSGFTRQEALGKTWQALTPEEFHPVSLRAVEQVMAVGEAVPYEKEYFRKDGSRWWGLFAPRRVGNETVEFVLDITARKHAEAALRESETRFRTLALGIPQLVWRACDVGVWTWASQQWLDYTGQSQEESHGLGWLEALHPSDRAAALHGWQEAERRGRLDVEYRVRRASDGAYRWHQTRALPLRGAPEPGHPQGRILEWLGTTTDVEDLKRLQEQQAVLLGELQHRSRNLLAVVRSVASRSFAPSPARDEFDARLAAISRVQNFLAQGQDFALELSDLIQAEMRAHAAMRSDGVTVRGPRVELPGSRVQPLAMALHELTTNALKHGALSQPAGRLSITWRVEHQGGAASLQLEWRESRVTMPAGGAPPRRGFGRELIERALPYQLQAATRLEFTPDGVHCLITLPLGADGPDPTRHE